MVVLSVGLSRVDTLDLFRYTCKRQISWVAIVVQLPGVSNHGVKIGIVFDVARNEIVIFKEFC